MLKLEIYTFFTLFSYLVCSLPMVKNQAKRRYNNSLKQFCRTLGCSGYGAPPVCVSVYCLLESDKKKWLLRFWSWWNHSDILEFQFGVPFIKSAFNINVKQQEMANRKFTNLCTMKKIYLLIFSLPVVNTDSESINN